MYLEKEIQSLKTNLSYAKKQVDSVSQKSVDWHIYHSLLVMSGICYLIKNSEIKNYNPKFSFLKWGIMTFEIIPRGKSRAPKQVQPPIDFGNDEIQKLFEKIENQLSEVEKLDQNHFYTHHMFGDLNLKKSIKFIGIHTNHHLKIMRDIIS